MSRKHRPQPARIALTDRALEDICAVERYSIDKWGRRTGDKYVDEIISSLDRLGENPQLLHREIEFSPGLYFYRVQRHILVCDYRDNAIVVLALIHAGMDIPARLAELEPHLAAEAEFLHAKLHGRRKSQ